MVCMLLGMNLNYVKIAGRLSIVPGTVKIYAERAAAKIPGDLPQAMKCAVWARGATMDVLTGQGILTEMRATVRNAVQRMPVAASSGEG